MARTIKMTETDLINNSTDFGVISSEELRDKYFKNDGKLFFIPHGYKPILVANNNQILATTNLFKPSQVSSNFTQLPDGIHLPQIALRYAIEKHTREKEPQIAQTRNAYLIFRTEYSEKVNMPAADVSKITAEIWRNATDDFKSKFQQLANQEKDFSIQKHLENRKNQLNDQATLQNSIETPYQEQHINTIFSNSSFLNEIQIFPSWDTTDWNFSSPGNNTPTFNDLPKF